MQVSYASRFDGISGSAIRDIFKLLTNPSIISFAGGNPASSALEPGRISQFAQEVLAENGVNILQYGQSEGYAPLRESAATFFRHNAVEARPDQVLPLAGSQQGLDLICKALLNPGDAMLVESPAFLGALQTFKLYQARLVPIEMDEGGAIVEDIERKIIAERPKLIYLIPTFQNPTGRTLALERRRRVAEIARMHGVTIIEDDPYCDLRYRGEALPAIKSFDKGDNVLYLNSFSKIISPGLRVAAVVCTDEEMMRKLVVGKQSTDVHSPNLNQAIIDRYLRSGLLSEHIELICASYAAQMSKMLEMLEGFPESVRFTRPDGGIFLWCELPEGFSATELLPEATRRGVAYIPGDHFYARPGAHHNTLRLNFSNASLENIEKGMLILKELLIEKGL
ncbi:MAG: PLP-dependent aminotransferase family protein [Christensenellaceae bacterium]|jgi:2-aminoadipate transaminase|nr:PLP-dependent aminotransferase family protein [Christensenellaceae bacterium]